MFPDNILANNILFGKVDFNHHNMELVILELFKN